MAVRGPGAVELITPEGGGGAQQIARPEHPPNYVQMYGEAMRAALEPAQFYWGMFKDRQELADKLQELGLKGSELDETKRYHQADEANKALDLALRNREADETKRAHQADEGYKAGLLKDASDRLAEDTRYHNQLSTQAQDRLQLDKDKETSEALLRNAQEADYNAQVKQRDQQYREKEKELNDQAHDDTVIAETIDKLKGYSPVDHYHSDTTPDLLNVWTEAHNKILTPYGEKRLSELQGKNLALGQELDRQIELSGFNTVGKDSFLREFNAMGPEARETYTQRFDRAFGTAKQMNKNEEERRLWPAVARTAYDRAKVKGDEETAMGAGREALETFKATIKPKVPTWTISDINKVTAFSDPSDPSSAGQLIKMNGVQDDQEAARQSRIRRAMMDAYGSGGNPQDVLDAENQRISTLNAAGGANAKPEDKAKIEEQAARLKATNAANAANAAAGKLRGDVLVSHKPAPVATPAPTPPTIPIASGGWPAHMLATAMAGTAMTPSPQEAESPWAWMYRNITQAPQEPQPTPTPATGFFKPTEESGSPTPMWAQTRDVPRFGIFKEPWWSNF